MQLPRPITPATTKAPGSFWYWLGRHEGLARAALWMAEDFGSPELRAAHLRMARIFAREARRIRQDIKEWGAVERPREAAE